MAVLMDGKKLIPAPFPSWTREAILTDDGRELSALYNIEIRGHLVAFKGSPNSSGVFWDQSGYPPDEEIATDSRLTAIIRKQKAMRDLFSQQGKVFQIDGYDGFELIKWNPRIKSIEFTNGEGNGNWFDKCDYVIQMEADASPADGVVTRVEDTWTVEPTDEKAITYKLTRRASATGRTKFADDGSIEKLGWEVARSYVLDQLVLGLDQDRLTASGVLDATSLVAYNHQRSQEINEEVGSFSVTETWTGHAGGSAVEDYTVTVRHNTNEQHPTVSVEGTITGLDTDGSFTTNNRYTNAKSKWDSIKDSLYTRAQTITGMTLSPTPGTNNVVYNQINGTISYNFEFNVSGSNSISSQEDTWTLEPADETYRVYRLTHRVSATSPTKYDDDGNEVAGGGWLKAKDQVLNVIGLGFKPSRLAAAGILDLNLNSYNHSRTTESNEKSGGFSVTETWTCAAEPALEDYSINVRVASDNGRTSVSVEGTITGLKTATGFQTNNKYTNANSKWGTVQSQLFERASARAGTNLNPTVLNKTIGHNEVAGTISYNYEYDSRPASSVTNSLNSTVTIRDKNKSDIHADIPVLGGDDGPVMQDIAKTAKQRTVSIEVQMPVSFGSSVTRPNTSSIVLSNRPNGTRVFLDDDEETWSADTGRYSRQTQWTYK